MMEGGHAGNINAIVPPHRFLLFETENSLMLVKTPSFGTSPSSILKERLRFVIKRSFPRELGIRPDKLLRERSMA
ncbi:hypothetical protein RJ639_024418 [Escallonia herrerae]|uniref:Uncharacterized protein n=1 Tax=Escallonia herrerae TaxID=1293975 RepID=A0AA88UZS8_9ASTE|nr:hypothetical protein RJ639_024418 [Escallonia herrerae]